MNPPRVDVEVLTDLLPWFATAAISAGAAAGGIACAVRRPSKPLWPALVAAFAMPGLVLAASGWQFDAHPRPFGGAAALAGLILLGVALATSTKRAFAVAAWALLASALLDGAPTGWGVLGSEPPFSPKTTSRLLDVSPRAFVMESAGADWMRHESIYEPAGTDRIGPDLRIGRGGSVAAYVVLVMGCCLAALRFALPSRASERSPDATHTA